MAIIKRKKKQFRQQSVHRAKVEDLQKQQDLKKLREERVRLEGRAELNQQIQTEQQKIDAAKKANPSKLRQFGTGLASVINKQKEKNRKKGKINTNLLGQINQGSQANFGGERAFNFGGNSGGSPFNLSPKIEQPKKKQRTITIKL